MNRLTWLRNPDQLAVITRTYSADSLQSGIHLWQNPTLGRLDDADDAIVVARQRFLFNGIAPYGSGRALVRQLQGNAQDHLLWDMTAQQPIESLHRSQRPTERLIVHPNGVFLRWDLKAGGGFIFLSIGNPLRTSLPQVLCASWSMDASTIISASTDGTDTMVDVFSAESGDRLASFGVDASVLEVALSANQEQLAIRLSESVRIVGADGYILAQFDGRARAILWHPSETTLFIATDSLWMVTAHGQSIALNQPVQEMVVSPDGTRLACMVQETMPNGSKQEAVFLLALG